MTKEAYLMRVQSDKGSYSIWIAFSETHTLKGKRGESRFQLKRRFVARCHEVSKWTRYAGTARMSEFAMTAAELKHKEEMS